MWYNCGMKIKVFLAVLACKCCRSLIRFLCRGGTDFPGRVALKICPNLLGELAKGVTTVIVTGTNGKTTTSRMIEQSWTDAGISFFANKSGANLLSGVTAEFAVHSSLTGKCRYTHALIESDEAAFKAISRFVDAKAVVVTNVFRDQLDRYGEVTHTLDNIRIGIENSKNAVLCVNADDSLCASLHDVLPNPVVFFGVDTPIYHDRVEELSDAPYCIRCKHEYVYDYVTYGHLGGYRCPNCGYHRPQPQVHVTKVLRTDDEHSEVIFEENGKQVPASIHLPGGYNIYNACACMAAKNAPAFSSAATRNCLPSTRTVSMLPSSVQAAQGVSASIGAISSASSRSELSAAETTTQSSSLSWAVCSRPNSRALMISTKSGCSYSSCKGRSSVSMVTGTNTGAA